MDLGPQSAVMQSKVQYSKHVDLGPQSKVMQSKSIKINNNLQFYFLDDFYTPEESIHHAVIHEDPEEEIEMAGKNIYYLK